MIAPSKGGEENDNTNELNGNGGNNQSSTGNGKQTLAVTEQKGYCFDLKHMVIIISSIIINN